MLSRLILEVSSVLGEHLKRRFSLAVLLLVAKGSWFSCAAPGSLGEVSWQLFLLYITRTGAGWWIGPLSPLSLHLRLLLPILAVLPPFPSSCFWEALSCCLWYQLVSWLGCFQHGTRQWDSRHPPRWQAEYVGLGTRCTFIRQILCWVPPNDQPKTAPSFPSWTEHNLSSSRSYVSPQWQLGSDLLCILLLFRFSGRNGIN